MLCTYGMYIVVSQLSSPPPSPSLSQAMPVQLSLDALLQMPGSQVRETMRRLGSSSEECGRLSAALSFLKTATESGRWTSRRVPGLGEAQRQGGELQRHIQFGWGRGVTWYV